MLWFTIFIHLGVTDATDPVSVTSECAAGEGSSETEPAVSSSPAFDLKVTHNKKTLDLTLAADRTVRDLKERLSELTGIPADKQKIMWSKGGCADNMVRLLRHRSFD